MAWSAADRAAPVAVHTLRATDSASHHIVLLNLAEKPHVHDRSDLTTFVLTGHVRMHFQDRVVDMLAGDVVDIPRGQLHWAENVSTEPSEGYVIFSPAFDGKDRRFVNEGERAESTPPAPESPAALPASPAAPPASPAAATVPNR